MQIYQESNTFQEENISYLDAKTYGIGQLITQRKLFQVPEHQRDFAWGVKHVEQFFEDIVEAWEDDAPAYFIGLIVLLGPHKNVWQILDGQQRLATTTMIYSAIRHWLVARENYNEDAKQIEAEFIGVRQLGGRYSPRLTMNVANQDTFLELVVQKCPTDEMIRRLNETPQYSWNRVLIEAALACRRLVDNFAAWTASSIQEQAARLFELSAYLEHYVKVAVLDVSSETNAFVIFEALNARGNDLSVLDLVKNHVFGQAGPQGIEQVRQDWMRMAKRIEDKSPDDFLKVFWTSRFGRVQKPQLYNRIIKSEFAGQEGAMKLASDLVSASEHYIALDDPKHEIWSIYGPVCKQRIETLILLGNRQVRAPIMSAIDLFDQEQMEFLLWFLIILTVRYQIVGQRRTGALEITCARIANLIHDRHMGNAEDIWNSIRTITPTDEEFHSDFLQFSERKPSRAVYFLTQLEFTARAKQGSDINNLDEITHHPLDLLVDFILPKKSVGDWQDVMGSDPELLEEWFYRLGNRCLLESELANFNLKSLSFERKTNDYYSRSKFLLTNTISSQNYEWGRKELEARQELLADLAVHTWSLPKFNQEKA